MWKPTVMYCTIETQTSKRDYLKTSVLDLVSSGSKGSIYTITASSNALNWTITINYYINTINNTIIASSAIRPTILEFLIDC